MVARKRFYLEPKNAHTNEVFAKALGEDSGGSFKAEHGKVVKAYECSADDREMFLDSKGQVYLEFAVWESSGGKLRRWYRKKQPSYGKLRLVPTT